MRLAEQDYGAFFVVRARVKKLAAEHLSLTAGI